jgi:ribosome maturation protein SDO1
MATIFTPQNQIKLTNVSIVRLKKGGKRFELACYKNKIVEFRSGITKDLGDVLQIDTVFTNVSKGQTAKKEELAAAFGDKDNKAIILEILGKGEVQVSTKEREHQNESLKKDIATIVADKCLNPQTKLPYPVSMIETAMSDMHISINPNLAAKQQALDVIKQLQKNPKLPISRAQMRVKIHADVHDGKKLQALLHPPLIASLVNENWAEDDVEFELLIEPGRFKEITSLVQATTKGAGTLYTVSLKEMRDS